VTVPPGWAVGLALFATTAVLFVYAMVGFRFDIFQRIDVERHWAYLLPTGTLIILLAVANAVLVLRGAP
jgi:hypothetical protein